MKDKMLAAVGVVCLILVQAACGGGGGPATPAVPAASPVALPTPVALGAVDPALVGTWVGPMSGAYGPSQMTLVLNADGTAIYEGAAGSRYCRAIGNWGVSGAEFAALGNDCTASRVNLVAPASSATLTGSWFALPGGAQGTFSVTRQ